MNVSKITTISSINHQTQIKNLSELPTEMIYCILQHIDCKSLLQFGMSNRRFRELHNDDTLWQHYYHRDFQTQDLTRATTQKDAASWKSLYSSLSNVAYPGIGANFRTFCDWSVTSTFNLVRQFAFETDNPQSLFYAFKLYGYSGGSIECELIFTIEHREAVLYYLKQLDCLQTDPFYSEGIGYIRFKTQEIIKKILINLNKHNQFPATEFSLIKEIVNAFDWQQITPLTDSEKSMIQI